MAVPPKCGRGLGMCPADFEGRMRYLLCSAARINGGIAALSYVLNQMHTVVDKRQEEKQHLDYHTKCSPLNCVVKQCPDPPCGPYPCNTENTCPMHIDTIGRKYGLLWRHLCQAMTETSNLKVENYELHKELDILIDRYITPHNDKEICLCCQNKRPGYKDCPCCTCLQDQDGDIDGPCC